MSLHSEPDAEQPVSTAFLPLSLLTITLRNTPDCSLKKCCKKYRKGKRCKSCPER